MKFRLYGKVVSRNRHRVAKKDGGAAYDLYQMVIEEPGLYPSRFQVATKDPGLMGDKDGPFAVGRTVVAEGFINGAERKYAKKDGESFLKYETWLTVKTLTAAVDGEPPTQAAAPAEESIPDDMPF